MDTSEVYSYPSSVSEYDTSVQTSSLMPYLMKSDFSTQDPSLNLTTVKGAQIQLTLYDYLIPAIGTLIIVLNLAVVVSSGLILKTGVQPKTTYLFLGNVAMADLITGVAVVFGQVYPRHLRGQTTCAVQLGMIVSSTLASIWSVALIAVDRFLYIGHGLKYQQWLYPRRARFLILCSWILGLVVGFLPAFGWSQTTNNGKVCWFIRIAPPGLIILTTIAGVIPVIIVVVLYSIILYYAIKKVIQLQKADKQDNVEYSQPGRQENAHKPNKIRVFRGGRGTGTVNNTKQFTPKKWKAVKVVLFTTTSFVVTWIPYFIACTIYITCKDDVSCKPLRLAIAAPLAILGFCNSLINPVIYAWWHNGFRKFMQKNIQRFQQLRSNRRETNSTSGSSSTRTTKTSRSNMSSTHSKSSEQKESRSLKEETHL